jgi:hypothetical protein
VENIIESNQDNLLSILPQLPKNPTLNCCICKKSFNRHKSEIKRTITNGGIVTCSLSCSRTMQNFLIRGDTGPILTTCYLCNKEYNMNQGDYSKK